MANAPKARSHKEEMMAAARLQIARRIARLCTSLSPGEFDRLLDKMVRVQWKYDMLPHLDPLQLHRDASGEDLDVWEA